MNDTAFRTVLVAAVVVLAGCAGGVAPGPDAGATAPDETSGTGNTGDGTGTVDLWVSDQPNAIGDFAHLNVTVTAVGFHRADGNESDDGAADDGAGVETSGNGTTAGNSTTAGNGTDGDGPADGEGPKEPDADGSDRGPGWVTFEVDNRTVDLTRLVGANATVLDEYDVPNGSYDAVFVYVGSIDATLEGGEQVRVKLPSERLKLNRGFSVGANTSVDFVFDVAVHRAGRSGKYVLRPVVGQSGTDVPIEDVGGPGRAKGADGKENRGRSASTGDLNATFLGNVTSGENATLEATRNDSAVANATVRVNGPVVGTTDAGGRLTVAIPDRKRVKVRVTAGDAEAELELEFESAGENDGGQGNDGQDRGDDGQGQGDG